MEKPASGNGKLDKARHDKIVKAIAGGTPRKHAAAIAGITRATLWNWMQRGKKEREGPYFDLLDAIKKAEAEFIQRNVKAIETAGRKSWQARAWLLERKHPDEFGLQRQEIAALRKEMGSLLKRLEQQNGAVDPGAPAAGAEGQGSP